ncbi:hypothetical protein CDCA_CDCA18G4500 [Cyanidium caldarium]|uniref:Uncharacterized protein n=1 Tax=Cyanidium caldarium TaxID=2771 RepID=A0AAV9J1M1_CYACA|nr:hypothetical protein CDCA_CDCA18G4500 [Cyanidium caldarium]
MLSFLDWGSTFRAKKASKPDGSEGPSQHPQSQLPHLLRSADAKRIFGTTLVDRAQLRKSVQLPEGEQLDDWIALYCVDFLNVMNLLYSLVYAKACTEESCPSMTAGPCYEYRWHEDGDRGRPVRLSAPRYIESLLEWAEQQLSHASLPQNRKVCRAVVRRFYRLFAHIYHHHMDTALEFGATTHLNTCFWHFYYFVREFNLISSKELEPLRGVAEVGA